MRKKIGISLMVIGLVMVLSALALLLYNAIEANHAEKSVQEILPQVVDKIKQNTTDDNINPFLPMEEQNKLLNPVMPTTLIGRYRYIGYLEIPVLDLKLPVMSEWDYDRLKVAPCRYVGSTRTDNIVIAAHNYRRHFGNIYLLKKGSKVVFTDMDGIVNHYKVAEVDTLQPTAIEEMTSSNYDLTLFTCTYGGRSRVTVRCTRID